MIRAPWIEFELHTAEWGHLGCHSGVPRTPGSIVTDDESRLLVQHYIHASRHGFAYTLRDPCLAVDVAAIPKWAWQSLI